MEIDSDCIIILNPNEEELVYEVYDVSSSELSVANDGSSYTTEECYPTTASASCVSVDQIESSSSLKTSTEDQMQTGESLCSWFIEFPGPCEDTSLQERWVTMYLDIEKGNTPDGLPGDSQDDSRFSLDGQTCYYNISVEQMIPDSSSSNNNVQEGCGVFPVCGSGILGTQAPLDNLQSGSVNKGSSLEHTGLFEDIGASHAEEHPGGLDWISKIALDRKLSSDSNNTERVDGPSARTEDEVAERGVHEVSRNESIEDMDTDHEDYYADTEDNVDEPSHRNRYSLEHGDIVLASESLFPPFCDMKDNEDMSSVGNVLGVIVNPGSVVLTEQFIYCRETGESGGLEMIQKYTSLPVTEAQRPEYINKKMIAVCRLQEPDQWAFVSPSFLRRAKDKDLELFGQQKIDVRVSATERRIVIDENPSSDLDTSFIIINSLQDSWGLVGGTCYKIPDEEGKSQIDHPNRH